MDAESFYISIAPVKVVKAMGSYVKHGIAIRYVNERFYAYRTECPHMPGIGDLQDGEFCEKSMTVKCPAHGFKFCIESGRNKIKELQKYGNLDILEVMIENDCILVKIYNERKFLQDR